MVKIRALRASWLEGLVVQGLQVGRGKEEMKGEGDWLTLTWKDTLRLALDFE